MKTQYQKQDEIREYAIDYLTESVTPDSVYGADLHNEVFNTDYYIIGTWEAKEWLKDFTFDAIECIKEYEQDNFGEVNTDLSCPEKVVNMYVYIIGENVLNESESIRTAWNRLLTEEDIKNIIEDLS
jgi:hypothetical protein